MLRVSSGSTSVIDGSRFSLNMGKSGGPSAFRPMPGTNPFAIQGRKEGNVVLTAVSIVAAAILSFGIFGQNLFLTVLSLAVLLMGSALLWRPGDSPILIFLFGFQWLQSSALIFYANWLGRGVAEIADIKGDVEKATILSLVAILALAGGIRLSSQEWRSCYGAPARQTALSQPARKWFGVYVAAFLAAFLMQAAAGLAPGWSQVLLALANLKWAFFFMLAYVTFVRGRGHQYFISAFLIELCLAAGGYFSDFKTPMIFTLFALAASGVRPSARSMSGLLILAGFIVVFGVVWTAVKGEYRDFLIKSSEGGAVTYVEKIAKLSELVRDLDQGRILDSTDKLIRRMSYVEIFGAVLVNVPRFTPHEDGAIWFDAISRPFLPRLLFPDKSAIDDSSRTNYYAGLNLSGSDDATSISIGYIGEAYIDFGEYGMMAPVLLLGCLLGIIYRSMTTLSYSRGLLGTSIGSAIIFGETFLETSVTKSFGGLIAAWLVGWLFVKGVAPRLFPWMQYRTLR